MNTRYGLNAPSSGAISSAEQQDFDLIVNNAAAMGWLPCGGTLIVTRDDCGILVRAMTADCCWERRYEDGRRWLFELLHDLAHGMWKTHSPPM